jgi:large subunit ribosomal protein L18
MKLDKRRRRENKTNYNKRLILLRGESPRLVIRKTNKYLILQIIESIHAQDKILYSFNTRDLLKLGWPKEKKGSLKSLGAAYVGGMVLGNKAKDLKNRLVVDTGLIPSTKGSRIYAAIKGVSDSGITINYDKEIAPSKERIEGENEKIINDILNKIGGKKK